MKKYFYSLLLFSATQITLEANERVPTLSESQLQEAFVTQTFTQFYQDYWNFLMEEFPEWATMAGFPGNDGRWQERTEGAFQQRKEKVERFAEQLKGIKRELLSAAHRLNYDILEWDIENRIEDSSFDDDFLLVNAFNGIQSELPQTLLYMPRETEEQAKNLFSRLQGIPQALEEAVILLKRGLEKNVTTPKVVMKDIPSQIDNLLTKDPKESILYLPFKELSEQIETREQIQKEAEDLLVAKIFPAFRQLKEFLVDQYIPNCRETTGMADLPNGRSWYQHKVKYHTSTDLTPEEIHQMGLKEVERIRSEIDQILVETGFEHHYEKFTQFINQDKEFFFDQPEALLDCYKEILKTIQEKLPLLFGKLSHAPVEVVPIPAFSAPSQIAAYYLPGSVEWNRPGYFFVNLHNTKSRPKWEMDALALHEALPGHHLQISLAQEASDQPEFRKHLYVTAFVEGWALYAEGLGKELGVYQNPYSRFGRLSYELFRAARLVVDTGLHYYGWTREQAIDYMKTLSAMSEEEVIREVDRYLVIPGQALAYKVGELKIKEWRKLCEEKLGDQFEIRAFHDMLLSHGSALPLNLLEDQISIWLLNSLNEEKQGHSADRF